MFAVAEKSEQAQAPLPLLRRIFAPRTEPGFDRLDALVMLLYAAVLAFAIHHYQPFSDEAQEWLIARDCSLGQILFRRLHYEGHPALWACFLWVLCRLHVPFVALNWIAGALALPGIYLLLRFSPFPRIFRMLLPFTFFLQYQYAAVARPYVLVPGLLFTLCILYTQQRRRPLLFALVCGALANIGLHAAIIAAVFLALYTFEWFRQRNVDEIGMLGSKAYTKAWAAFTLCFLCSAAVAFPAPDVVTAFAPNKRVARPIGPLTRLVPEEAVSHTPLDPALDLASLAEQKQTPELPVFITFLIKTLILTPTAGFYPLAESNLLASLFMLCMLRWLWRRGSLRLVFPYLVVVLISAHVFLFDHHTGQFLLCLIAAVWIALNLPEEDPLRGKPVPVQAFLQIAALVVITLQIGWSAHCIREGARVPTDPGRQLADFLTGHYPGKRIAGYSFENVSAQPYVDHNLYFNWPDSYWIWSVNTNTNRRRTEVLQQHPDVVVVGDVQAGTETWVNQWFKRKQTEKEPYTYLTEFWETHGYRVTHRFCGNQYRRMGISYTFCENVMEPTKVGAALE